jgi:hypothetical protein
MSNVSERVDAVHGKNVLGEIDGCEPRWSRTSGQAHSSVRQHPCSPRSSALGKGIWNPYLGLKKSHRRCPTLPFFAKCIRLCRWTLSALSAISLARSPLTYRQSARRRLSSNSCDESGDLALRRTKPWFTGLRVTQTRAKRTSASLHSTGRHGTRSSGRPGAWRALMACLTAGTTTANPTQPGKTGSHGASLRFLSRCAISGRNYVRKGLRSSWSGRTTRWVRSRLGLIALPM